MSGEAVLNILNSRLRVLQRNLEILTERNWVAEPQRHTTNRGCI